MKIEVLKTKTEIFKILVNKILTQNIGEMKVTQIIINPNEISTFKINKKPKDSRTITTKTNKIIAINTRIIITKIVTATNKISIETIQIGATTEISNSMLTIIDKDKEITSTREDNMISNTLDLRQIKILKIDPFIGEITNREMVEDSRVSTETTTININKIQDIIITTNEEMNIGNLMTQENTLGLILIEIIEASMTKISNLRKTDKGEDRDQNLLTMKHIGKGKNFRKIVQIVEIRGKMS